MRVILALVAVVVIAAVLMAVLMGALVILFAAAARIDLFLSVD